MASESSSKLELELQETVGALDLLVSLREEFAQWAAEAQDNSKKEALENVLSHVEAIEDEYKHRRNALQKQIGAG